MLQLHQIWEMCIDCNSYTCRMGDMVWNVIVILQNGEDVDMDVIVTLQNGEDVVLTVIVTLQNGKCDMNSDSYTAVLEMWYGQ